MTQGQRHHFVPQVYLKNFSNTSKQTHVYDIRERKHFQAKTTKIAVARSFYELPLEVMSDESNPPKGLDPNIIEKSLGKIETNYHDIYKDILRRISAARRSKAFPRVISPEMKKSLSYLLYLQYCRTRESRRRHSNFMRSGVNAIYRKFPELFGADHNPDDNPKESPFNISDDYIKASHIQMMVDPEVAETVINAWSKNYIFMIGKTTQEHPLITSDHPAISHNHFGGSKGLLVDGMEFAMPLNPQIILLIIAPSFKNIFGDHKIVKDGFTFALNRENVEFYNSRQVFQCHSQLYSKDGNFGLVERMLTKHPELGTRAWDDARGVVIDGERMTEQ